MGATSQLQPGDSAQPSTTESWDRIPNHPQTESTPRGTGSPQAAQPPPQPTPRRLFPQAADDPSADCKVRVVVSTKPLKGIVNGRIHLLTEEGTTVGCGWKPKPGGVVDLLKSDYDNEPHTYGKCIRCFKNPQQTQSRVCLQAVFQMILWTPARKMRRSPLRRSKDCQPSRRCRWKAGESNRLDDQPFASWMQVPLALVYP